MDNGGTNIAYRVEVVKPMWKLQDHLFGRFSIDFLKLVTNSNVFLAEMVTSGNFRAFSGVFLSSCDLLIIPSRVDKSVLNSGGVSTN